MYSNHFVFTLGHNIRPGHQPVHPGLAPGAGVRPGFSQMGHRPGFQQDAGSSQHLAASYHHQSTSSHMYSGKTIKINQGSVWIILWLIFVVEKMVFLPYYIYIKKAITIKKIYKYSWDKKYDISLCKNDNHISQLSNVTLKAFLLFFILEHMKTETYERTQASISTKER